MALIAGIDISERQIRAAFVHTTFRTSTVVAYAREDILPTESGLSQAYAALMQKAPSKPDVIVAGMSGTRTSLHLLELPKGVVRQANAVLPGELETLVPFGLEAAILDHQVIEQDRLHARLWAVAAATKDVSSRVEELATIGAYPAYLIPQSLSLSALASIETAFVLRDGVIALVNIRDSETDFCILDQGLPRYCQTLSAGLQQVQLGQRKALSDHLVRALTSYRASTDYTIGNVVLTGAAVNMPGALKWLSDELSLPCQALELPSASSALSVEAPADCGAALSFALYASHKKKAINLRQGPLALETPIGSNRELVLRAVRGAAAVIVSAYIFLVASCMLSEKKLASVENELANVTAQIWGIRVASVEEAQTLIGGGSAQSDPMPDDDAYDVLGWISEAIPPDIRHDTKRLVIERTAESNEAHGEIAGLVDNIAQRDQIVAALKDKACFSEVEPGSTNPSSDGRQNYQLDFKIKCGATLKVANAGDKP